MIIPTFGIQSFPFNATGLFLPLFYSLQKLWLDFTRMADRKAVIKNADMSEEMQQDAVDCATQALEKYNIEKVRILIGNTLIFLFKFLIDWLVPWPL